MLEHSVTRRSWPLLLGLAIGFTLLAPGCRAGPPSVSLANLAANQGRYQGKEVQTTGLLRRFTDPSGPYFVIEDAASDRVEVLPTAAMAGYEGRGVEVRGRFGVSQTLGRFIEVEHIFISGQ